MGKNATETNSKTKSNNENDCGMPYTLRKIPKTSNGKHMDSNHVQGKRQQGRPRCTWARTGLEETVQLEINQNASPKSSQMKAYDWNPHDPRCNKIISRQEYRDHVQRSIGFPVLLTLSHYNICPIWFNINLP